MLGQRLAAHLGLLWLRMARVLSGHVGAQPLKTAEPRETNPTTGNARASVIGTR